VDYTFVWVNGVLLSAADITATNGTDITFTSALALNDEVRILSFKAVGTVAVADISGLQTALDAKANQATTYTKTEVDTALGLKLDASAGAVGTANIADSAVTDAKIAAMAASKLTGDVAAARITNALNASGSAPIYACRAWVNFNGTGTVAIRASGNVSSITDNGTGNYTVNFTTAMPDANYAANANGSNGITSVDSWIQPYLLSASAVSIGSYNNSSVLTDRSFYAVSVFR
jgi:hypothetical protein